MPEQSQVLCVAFFNLLVKLLIDSSGPQSAFSTSSFTDILPVIPGQPLTHASRCRGHGQQDCSCSGDVSWPCALLHAVPPLIQLVSLIGIQLAASLTLHLLTCLPCSDVW